MPAANQLSFHEAAIRQDRIRQPYTGYRSAGAGRAPRLGNSGPAHVPIQKPERGSWRKSHDVSNE
jgi:hypothetical protein